MQKKNVRLPKDIVPKRYELTLRPDLDAFVFEGQETIHIEIQKTTKTITLHSIELDIESAQVALKGGTLTAQKIRYDEKSETATFHFAQVLAKGPARLELRFRGTLNDKMRGFYRSSFVLDGKTKHLATTQFESTDARRAFPCFDEPAIKAVFEITLVLPSEMTAISNTMPIDIREHEVGYKTVRFAPTPPMSTYLAAFIVGDFEHIEKKSADGVLIRVFTTPGKKHQARFALECAAKTITFFNKYFDVPYPLPVVDLIAIPDFAAGAMENWGAITYRESALLVDPERSSSANKQWVALVIAHELAHQWFGNLVTMEWWTHLWLNEGFASYIEYLAVDHLFPSWDIWTQFLVSDMRPALRLDALKHTHAIEVDVHHPSEIASVFDSVSYSKGASVIRMLAEYLGEANFRDGLRFYLKKHRHGNTETKDLWRALERVSGKPVGKMMAAWTRKAGYPLLTVSESGDSLEIRQSRFFSSPLSRKSSRDATRWQVPVSVVSNRGKAKPILMQKAGLRLPVRGAWAKVNAGETAFYRSAYSEGLRGRLATAAANKELNVNDRLGLIRDVFAVSEAGDLSAADALRFAAMYKGETEYVVWAEMASSLAGVRSLIAMERFAMRFDSFALRLFSRIGRKLHWTRKPKDHPEALLKTLVLGALGRYGDAATLARSRKLFAAAARGKNRIPADLRAVVYNTVATSGGAAEHAALLRMYKAETLHEEKNRIAGGLCSFRQKPLLRKTLAFALSKDVRPQDSVRIIAGVAMNRDGETLAWDFMRAHWKTLVERYRGGRELSHLIESLGRSTSEQFATDLQRFARKHPVAGTERALAQTLEQIRSNAAWLKRDRGGLREFLTR